MSDLMLFPTILYGDRETTRREWRKVAKTAWRAGEWGNCLDSLELLSVNKVPTDILLQRGFFGSGRRGAESHWRLYWTSKSIALCKPGAFVPEVADRACRLVFPAMWKYLWFTVGMLRYEDADVPQCRSEIDAASPLRPFFREMLRCFVNWLPEICSLSHRFGDETYAARDYAMVLPLSWTAEILRSAHQAGFRFRPESPNDIAQSLGTVDGHHFANWLVDRGIVERDGSRFRICEPRQE